MIVMKTPPNPYENFRNTLKTIENYGATLNYKNLQKHPNSRKITDNSGVAIQNFGEVVELGSIANQCSFYSIKL